MACAGHNKQSKKYRKTPNWSQSQVIRKHSVEPGVRPGVWGGELAQWDVGHSSEGLCVLSWTIGGCVQLISRLRKQQLKISTRYLYQCCPRSP